MENGENYSVTLPGWKWLLILDQLDKAAARQKKSPAMFGVFSDTAKHIRSILSKQ